MKNRKTLLVLLGILFAWAILSQVTYAWWRWQAQAASTQTVQLPFLLTQFGRTIADVIPPYEASGLRRGDEVVQIDGVPMDGVEMEAHAWDTGKPGDRATVAVNRGSETIKTSFVLKPRVHDASEWPLVIIVNILMPITGLLVGFYIAFARPKDSLAWITMAMLASFSQAAGVFSAVLLPSPLREMLFVYQSVLTNTWPLWMLLFGLYFPVAFGAVKNRPWIGWIVAIPSMVFAGLDIYGSFQSLHNLGEIQWLAKLEQTIGTPQTVWYVLLVFGFFWLLTWKRHTLTDPDAKRRLRLLIFGCSLALTPSLLVVASALGWLPRIPLWAITLCLAPLLIFPLTMAYVIVVQRAMDVRMVIRSGVQYAFASNGIRVVQLAIVALVTVGTLKLAQEADHRMQSLLIAAIGGFVVLSIRRTTEWLTRWMDRRFFREAYNADRILTDLSNSVAGIRDVKELLETVTRRISETMHVPSIAVFLERNGVFQPAYALGSGALDTVTFRRDASVVQQLRRQGSVSRVYFEDPQNWVHGAQESEQAALRQLDTQILLPLSMKNRLLGIMSLSRKRSEEPYSRADLQLLGAVASQTGLALENAELTDNVRRQIAQRERLDRELEIAREVQQRLFPQKLPVVNGLDFAGYCRPAEGVGGDYYDFIHLPDSSLGIAVGDVSGKGIAAALMMASLQASLRGQTIKPCETLSEMIQHINKLVYDASAENRYATFFYAQYHPATKVLRYVNAGHNPPIVWRPREGRAEILRLDEGGTVVGMFPDYPFHEAAVQLQKGDVVVAFTDGISEAMNKRDEEFEEERLLTALKGLEARTAAEMIGQILVVVDGFTAGAEQHDDMTLVVVRVQ